MLFSVCDILQRFIYVSRVDVFTVFKIDINNLFILIVFKLILIWLYVVLIPIVTITY